MPHVDELLGPATFAAAGLVVAIALQPMAGRPAVAPVADTAPVTSPTATAVVRLPTVEVVGRRTSEVAARGCDEDARRREHAIAARSDAPRA
jgi:hypothetical protein